MRFRFLLLLLVALIAATGCGRKKRPAARVPVTSSPQVKLGATQTGMASWYGYPYHGRRAANGEVFDMEKMTAAHRELPFETRVMVENLDNNRAVEVRITDRGPFVKDRIIDLSKAAAREIDMLRTGIAPVRLTITGIPGESNSNESGGVRFTVQAGAFREKENAEDLLGKLEVKFAHVRIVQVGDPPLWRVLVGRELAADTAAKLAEKVSELAGGAFVIRDDQN